MNQQQTTDDQTNTRGVNARRSFNSFRLGRITVNPELVYWLKGDSDNMFGDSRFEGLRDRTEWLAMQNYGITLGGMTAYMKEHPTTLIAVAFDKFNKPTKGWEIPYEQSPREMSPDELAAAATEVAKRS